MRNRECKAHTKSIFNSLQKAWFLKISAAIFSCRSENAKVVAKIPNTKTNYFERSLPRSNILKDLLQNQLFWKISSIANLFEITLPKRIIFMYFENISSEHIRTSARTHSSTFSVTAIYPVLRYTTVNQSNACQLAQPRKRMFLV